MNHHAEPPSPSKFPAESPGIDQQLLARYRQTVRVRFPELLERILACSAAHGPYGQELLGAVHDKLPRTTCGHCGRCCNAISLYSLEYHRIVRDLMHRLPPEHLKRTLLAALRFDTRLAEIGEERRVRCVFRSEEQKICLIHPVRPFPCRLFGQPAPDREPDCLDVHLMDPREALPPEEIESLQMPICEASEHIEVIAGSPAIPFFPFEFWLIRAALGEDLALRIYRDILVPSSTPLMQLWQAFPPVPADEPED